MYVAVNGMRIIGNMKSILGSGIPLSITHIICQYIGLPLIKGLALLWDIRRVAQLNVADQTDSKFR